MNKEKVKKIINLFIFKSLLVTIITLVLLISMKLSISFKATFYSYVYDTNISFAKFNNLYNKYFKDFKNKESIKQVLNEGLAYKEKEKYEGGVRLKVSNNYTVQAQNSGIIVFIGKKDKFNNTVIIQQVNGVDVWYGNVENIKYKLYDYVKEGDIIGTSSKYLYLLYKKDGKIIDYEKYI